MPDLYKISGERLTGFADQARRLGKVTGRLNPEQIEQVLKTVAGGGLSVFQASVTDETGKQFVSVNELAPGGVLLDVTTPETLSGAKYYYADAILPGIPEQMLAEYPYAFIRKNTANEAYQLMLSKNGFVFNGEGVIREKNGESVPQYTFPMGETTENLWRNAYNVQYSGWTIDEARPILWANQDIPDGTEAGAEIYFRGTEPVALCKFYYNGVLLPMMPPAVLAANPYAWIRKNIGSGYYDLFFSTERFYLVDADSISGANITKPWYRVEMAGADSAQSWTYYKDSTADLGFDDTRPVMWSSHDIPNGSADATEIFFAGSAPIPAE